MSRYTTTLVELCNVGEPRAKEIVDINKDLGYQIHRFRGALLTVLVTDSAWRSPDSEFIAVADGLYVWRDNEFQHVCMRW